MPFGRDIRTGLTVALITLVNAFAYASLLASGPLASFLPPLLVSTLVATAVTSLTLARFHTLPSALGGPAGSAAAVVAAALAAVTLGETQPAIRAADVTAVLALSALLPGLTMIGLWRLRLGRAIRFVPYPVLAGFLGGTGWLLLAAATRVAQALPVLVATAAFAVALRFAQARWKSPYLVPLGVLGGSAVTYAVLAVCHVSLDAARAQHWLYAILPSSGIVLPLPAVLRAAHWNAVAGAWSAFVWIAVVAILVSMVNGASLEVEAGMDTDVDRDLAALGTANVVAAVLGGLASQLALPTSQLAAKLAPKSRAPGFIVAAIALVAAFEGGGIVPFLVTPVFAGLLALYGIQFLEQYVVLGVRRMPRVEAAAVVAMLLCTALAGLQAALVLGLLFTCIAFISSASRENIVRRSLTLRAVRSRVERAENERGWLDAHGDSVEILILQGHLFFGSANALYEALKPVVDSEPPRRSIVLDLANVHGIDLSAALSLAKLAGRARRRSVELAFAGVGPAFERELRRSGAVAAADPIYAHLDDALEVCENGLLRDHDPALPPGAAALSGALPGGPVPRRLARYVERIELADNTVLFSAGDFADALYVIVAGKLAVWRDGVHLRTLVDGALVGEMGLFTGCARSATVRTIGPAAVDRLSLDALRRIESVEPELLAALARSIMRLQAERLRSANEETIAFHV